MKVAVIGGGVAGLVAAHRMASRVDVTLFESLDRLGGHAHTIEVEDRGRSLPIETGFVVFTDRTYPRFYALLDELGVDSQPATMRFSVRGVQSGIEIATHTVHTFKPSHLLARQPYQILYDALRFHRHARRYLNDPELTVGEYLKIGKYSQPFLEYLLLPPCAAGWCTDFDGVRAMPFARWYRFLDAQGAGRVRDLPVWRVVKGGSSRYVERLAASLGDVMRLGTAVERVERRDDGVWVTPQGGDPERFDEVIVATHADQALAMLAEPTEAEQRVLSEFRYSENTGCVHHDRAVLPRDDRLWSSWNYYLEEPHGPVVKVSYLMNVLFRYETVRPFVLSLNLDDLIDPALVVKSFRFTVPRIDKQSLDAQVELTAISGAHHVHYCGAHCGWGTHEDAVVSGEAAARAVLARL